MSGEALVSKKRRFDVFADDSDSDELFLRTHKKIPDSQEAMDLDCFVVHIKYKTPAITQDMLPVVSIAKLVEDQEQQKTKEKVLRDFHTQAQKIRMQQHEREMQRLRQMNASLEEMIEILDS